MSDQLPETEPGTQPGTEPLLAGKFKNAEELEKGYKNLESTLSSSAQKAKEAEDLAKSYAVPSEYKIEAELDEATVKQLVDIAKEAGLTQAQFDKAVIKFAQNNEISQKEMATKKESIEKDIGADNLKALDSFIDQTYTKSVAATLKSQSRFDKTIAQELLGKRNEELNKSFPTGKGIAVGTDLPAIKKQIQEKWNHIMANPMDTQARREFERLGAQAAQLSKNA